MQELKNKDKVVQKMSRDGLTEQNQTTGEQRRISSREREADFTKQTAPEEPPLSSDPAGQAKAPAQPFSRSEKSPEHQAAINRLLERAQAAKTRKESKAAIQKHKLSQSASRLQFTEEERADPALSKYINRSEKAADQAEQAHRNIPKNKRIATARRFDEKTGRAKVRLTFEESEKPPDKNTPLNPASYPAQEVRYFVHGKIREVEKDNSGVEAAHRSEQFGERVGSAAMQKVRTGYHSKKMKPYREAAKADRQLQKANAEYLYQKARRENPNLAGGNPLSHFFQKQRIKREYAKQLREQAKQTGKTVKGAAKTTRSVTQRAKDAAKKTSGFAVRHWKGLLVAVAAVLLFIVLLSGLSSCAAMFQSTTTSVVGSSYLSADEDILAVEQAYQDMEADLQSRVDNIESEYPGYDEYVYELTEIGHNPYTLASYLTAKLYDYTPETAQAELETLFAAQYRLTTTERVETRTREETTTDPETGEAVTEEVEYEYKVLTVTLTNTDISLLAAQLLTEEQKAFFDLYQSTKGNRPELFGSEYNPAIGTGGAYQDYDIPPEALEDEIFAAMIAEAEKYLGWPYVWGGSSPSTSFDCSGFVCWVINQSGAGNIGRTTAQGIFDACAKIAPSEAKPGDIVFFTGTYNSGSAVSHVGIYVGNNVMIHCGDPISYADLGSSYWQQHFYAFGRLP